MKKVSKKKRGRKRRKGRGIGRRGSKKISRNSFCK
jgi:hypothetical protein